MRETAVGLTDRQTPQEPAPTSERIIERLRELMAALNRRVPRLEGTGELDIARDAAALRDKALARIAELETSRE